MFDSITIDLINSAPEVPEIDIEELPERLTELYLLATSLRLRSASNDLDTNNDLLDIALQLRKLADTYAIFVASGTNKDAERSSAFVSGFTYRIIHEASKVEPNIKPLDFELRNGTAPTSLMAVCLLLISGYTADSSALAQDIEDTLKQLKDILTDIEYELVRSLVNLGKGDIESVLLNRFEVGEVAVDEQLDISSRATQLLWRKITDGIYQIALQIVESEPDFSFHRSVFEEVRDLSYTSLALSITDDREGPSIDAGLCFAGPYVLASLLLRLGDGLLGHTLPSIPPPDGVDHGAWVSLLSTIARHRPYLWQNHLQAIDSGYLENGVSSVIAFPTGAGKTTLSELKIAGALLSSKKVIVLSPTHALANQTRLGLTQIFNEFDVKPSVIGDGYFSGTNIDAKPVLPDIAVMTPERCLLLVDVYPDLFQDVGLLVFDECHIMHPSRGIHDRRAIDAMMSFLKVSDASDPLDVVLMSAMVKNGEEIASWIENKIGRKCLSLNLQWKPTRQARGCVVYDQESIERLDGDLTEAQRAARKAKKPKNPPVALKRKLLSLPYGFFGLQYSWESGQVKHYKLCQLLDDATLLSANTGWNLTGNKLETASDLAKSFHSKKIKVIVFCQSKSHCHSVQNKILDKIGGNSSINEFTADENSLIEEIIDECGDVAGAILPSSDGIAVHHGLLNSGEKRLAEMYFQRSDGAQVIIATPTLAQGMNLPAQAVILAGVDRFDAASNQQALVSAHELLNACGRAGRAGHRPEGFVLMVPDRVVSFDADKARIGSKWMELKKSIFSQSDQCLDINDPIELILDNIQNDSDEFEKDINYFVNRLPLIDEIFKDLNESRLKDFVNSSFAAFRMNAQGRDEELVEKVALLTSRRKGLLFNETEGVTWLDELASANGIASSIINSLSSHILKSGKPTYSCEEWLHWLFDWLTNQPDILNKYIRSEGVVRSFGNSKVISDDEGLTPDIFIQLRPALSAWLNGLPLSDIEDALPKPLRRVNHFQRARNLSTQLTLDLSYLFGLATQIWQLSDELEGEVPLDLSLTANCIRNGVPTPEHYAVLMYLQQTSNYVSRPHVCREYEKIKDNLSSRDTTVDMKTLHREIQDKLDWEEIDWDGF